MNSIINFVMKNKLAVWLLTLIITVAGIYAGTRMKLETIPDITIPVITVTTVYPGATPEQVAQDVSEPFEKAVSNLAGVKTVSSTSFQNASSLQIEYTYGVDMKEAETEVKDALDKIKKPDNVKDPSVARISINAFPVIALSVSNKQKDLDSLTNDVEKIIVPKLKGIEGVSSVAVSGQQVEEVSLVFDQEKLAQLGLNESTVKMIVQGTNVTMPLGLFQFDDEEQSVVVDGKVTTLEDLENIKIPVASPTGMSSVTLKEIAKINFIGKAESISRTNGQEAIAIQIVKAQDANTVEVVNAVKDMIPELNKDFDGIDIKVTLDQGEPIEASVDTMINKALFGALFAVLVILLFLRNFKSTIISIISIPLSILIAFILLNQMDITLNMMTLGAMTVAIARVIDDSIVVVENIYRRMSLPSEKLKGRDLIREATKEMFIPIMSSTLVTIAVFLPLGLVSGMVGELFLPFALTMVFALLASLLVAVTIVPMLSHTLFRKNMEKGVGAHKETQGKLATGYKKILNSALNHKAITSISAVIVLAASLFLIPVVGVSFLPDEEQKMMYVTYTPDAGETTKDVNASVEEVENYFLKKDKVDIVQVSIGGANPMSPGASNSALMYVTFDSDTAEFSKVKEDALKDIQAFDVKGEWKSQEFSTSGSSNKVSYYIYGNNKKDIEPVVEKIATILEDDKDLKDVDTSLSKSYKEYTFVVDKEKLTQYGLTTAQIGMKLNPNVPREVLTTITKDDQTVDVYIDQQKEKPSSVDDLLKQTIATPVGLEVPISELVTIQKGKSSDTVSRREGKIFASASGTLTAKDVAKTTKDIQAKIDKLDVPAGVEIKTAGVTEDITQAFTQLGLAMLAAIAIVYLILVITFGGGLAPFAILFSLPFTAIGALVGLAIAGETLSVSSMLGLLMLIGIVVTNAIVLIDRVIHKEKEGLPTREAILEAGATRLRPILMTALATIGALIPLAIGAEGSGLISKGLGVTVIGGLTSSTLLTLIFVPMVYEFFAKFRRKKGSNN
ncbi:efflux RND transporter permease subunit [Psychrobacillus sp. NPDC058041]|uniref:efflux RND transporter permease subunit n=1 Tax=Psychrobacillus sp. NPDC058041 TaxID=3346310 RepID=UPI0036DA2F65